MTAAPFLLKATEREFQSLVIDYARLRGWMVAHFRPAPTQSGGWSTPMQGDRGYPDLTLARDGVVVHAELKSETGRVSPSQKRWLEHLGGVVWRPSDFDEIKRVLA